MLFAVPLLFIGSAQGVVAQGWLVWQGAPADANGAVAAISPSDVWVMGNVYGSHGVLRHWNGTSWEPQIPAPAPGEGASVLYSIAAASASDAWVAGYRSGQGTELTLIDHYDGADWSTETTPDPGTSELLLGVAASSPSNAWAVGRYYNDGNGSYDALPLHNDGTGWTFIPAASPAVLTEFYAVATLSSSDAWAVGRATTGPGGAAEPLVEHWNGSVWSVSFSPASGFNDGNLVAAYEVSSSDVWAVGSDGVRGLVEHWDGSHWERITLPAGPGGTSSYLSVSGSGAGDIWIGGSLSGIGYVWHWNGSSWSIAPTPGRSGSIQAGPVNSLSVLDDSTGFAQAGGPAFGGVLLTYGTGDFSSSIDAFRPDQPTIQRGMQVHLTGRLGFSEEASSWGETVHVDRHDPDGTHTALPDVTVDSRSGFEFSDTPPDARGTYTYTATYDGNASRSGASAQTTVRVQGAVSTLELSASAETIGYGQSVDLSARLTGYGSNNVVSIYRVERSGPVLVASGPADGGTFTTTLVPEKNAVFYASYEGDSTYEPATSTEVSVFVRAAISGRQSGFYKRSGSYRLYHFRASCARKGKRCPRYTSAVSPNKAGHPVVLTLQARIGRGWRTVGSGHAELGPNSKVTIILVYANTKKVIGKRFRVRAAYSGDEDHAGNVSDWSYLKITR